MRAQLTNHGSRLGSIKPKPAFQPPPPPPGMRWHREDGWKEGDLPSGYRPLVRGERMKQDSDSFTGPNDRVFETVKGLDGQFPMNPQEAFYRTSRPLTFNHAGKTWTWHKPGDPMPCDGERKAYIMYQDQQTAFMATAATAGWARNENRPSDIIGWRYADEKKIVPLGPEDVPPCCAFRRKDEPMDYIMPTSVYVGGIYGHDEIVFRQTWEYLKEHYQINRSIPFTGKWNPDAWEPCSKEVPA